MTGSSSPGPRLLPRLILVILGLGGSFLILEVTLRFTSLEPSYRPGTVDARQQHRLSGADHRQRSFRPTKDPGTFRLLVVGDSFTWGAGVLQEDAYPDRMETRLRIRRPDTPVEVVNWSRPGWNTARAWRGVAGRLDELCPDVLVLGFCLNDAEPSNRQRIQEMKAPTRRRQPRSAVSRALHAHSQAYRLLWEKLESLRQRRALDAYYRSLYGEEGAWEENREALARFHRWSASREVPILLVIFPIFNTQIDDGYPYRELHQLVASAATGLGMEVLDLLPVYEGMDGRRLALVPFTDGHPSEIAHRIAAQHILARLRQEGWLPPGAREDGELAGEASGAPGEERSGGSP